MRPRTALKSSTRNRVLYRKTDGRTSLVFCARVDKELGFLLFKRLPRHFSPHVLRADGRRLLPAHHAEVGVVCVESNLCEVYYRTEVAFEHARLPRHTGAFERTAFAALTPHISALRSLSAGVRRRRSRSRRRSTFRLPPRPTRKIFCPHGGIFSKTHFTVLAKHAPDETGACYLYEFLAARTAAGSCTSP